MRIAFITSHINKSTQWEWFSEDLKNRDIFHLHIILHPTTPQLIGDFKKLGIPCFHFSNSNVFLLVINLVRTMYILLKYRINIVHTELPHGNLVGQTAAFLCRVNARLTTTENASWAYDFNNRKQLFIDRLTYRLAKRVIVLTDLSKEYVHVHYHVPLERMTTIWHALRTSAYTKRDENKLQEMKTALKISPGDFVIGMVSRFEEWKGHRYVIEAIARLKPQYPHIKLHIAGGKGESYDAVVELIRKLNLGNTVVIHDFVKDNITLYQVFDAHIHIPVTRMAETFGIAIIEGMISACPQVLTLSGISVYTAQDKQNCLVVEYCSSEQVADSIEWMILHPVECKQMGAQARADAQQLFEYRVKTESHLKIYRELLEEA